MVTSQLLMVEKYNKIKKEKDELLENYRRSLRKIQDFKQRNELERLINNYEKSWVELSKITNKKNIINKTIHNQNIDYAHQNMLECKNHIDMWLLIALLS